LSLFEVNYERKPRMSFDIRKKGKHTKAEEFVKEMKKIHKEAKMILKKSQEEIKEYADRNKKDTVEYKMGDSLLLGTKNLMWQMRNRETKVNRKVCEAI